MNLPLDRDHVCMEDAVGDVLLLKLEVDALLMLTIMTWWRFCQRLFVS